MTLFHFLRAKSKTAQEQEDPLIETHTEIKKNGRFTVTATISNGKRIREVVEMRYPNSHQIQCRVTRTADELSGRYQDRTFNPAVWISKSSLEVPLIILIKTVIAPAEMKKNSPINGWFTLTKTDKKPLLMIHVKKQEKFPKK